jgi:hypothetical protein
MSCYTGRTGALVSLEGESVHALVGLYKIKGEESSAGSGEKNISNVARAAEVDLRTRNVETSHQGLGKEENQGGEKLGNLASRASGVGQEREQQP